mgnify:CR=1 FL=1
MFGTIKIPYESVMLLNVCKLKNGSKFEDAEILALSMTKKFPKFQFGWKILGAVLKKTGKFTQSLSANQKSVELLPQDVEAHNNLGIAFMDLGRLKEAEASYQKSIQIKSDFALSYYNLADVQKQLGKLKDAESNYKKVISLQPELAPAHNNLGNLLQELGRLDEALASLKKSIFLKPDYAEAHNNLANTLRELGRFNEAEESCRQALLLKPNLAEGYNNLCIILERLNQLEKAEKSCRKALEINPKFIEAYENLGRVLKSLNKLSEAEECYKKVILFKPDFVQAYDELGVIQQASGKMDDAEKNYKKIISLNPLVRPITISKGTIFYRKGNYEKALKYFDSYNTWDARARALETLYHLGRVDEIYKRLEINANEDQFNLKTAAFASFIAEDQQKETAHKFCKKPLDFLYFSNLSSHIIDSNKFISNVISDLKDIPIAWEIPGQSVKMGFQTDGDLFRFPKINLQSLKKIIYEEIDTYYLKFKNQKCGFIKNWPTEKNIKSWHIVLKKQGYNNTHIHPEGWLSGVIYLKVVPTLGKNEGAIKFDIGGRFSDRKYSTKLHNPKMGDIILFPSSLYHGTIPFSSEAERIIISFDLIPIRNSIIKTDEYKLT